MEVLLPSLEDIEEIIYPLTCNIFERPDYPMPSIKKLWHDKNKMDSALGALHNSYFTTIPEMGAALVYYINKDHPFVDGNKRMSIIVLFSFLLLNDYRIKTPLPAMEGVAFIEKIAASSRGEAEHVRAETTRWIQDHFVHDPESLKQLLAENES